MIDTAELVRLIQGSAMTEEMKKALLPVVQVANEELREEIHENIQQYNKKIEAIKKGKAPFSPEAIMYIYEQTKKLKFKKNKQKKLLKKEIGINFS